MKGLDFKLVLDIILRFESHYKKGIGAVVVYDVCKEESF